MAFPYRHVVMIGATSGIGKAMADRLIAGGAKVTAVGRRKDRLDEFVAKHGNDKAKAAAFDIEQIESIPQFVKDIVATSPDIDCLFLNAGTQHRQDFSKPETVDISKFNSEITVNFTSFVVLVHAFLPYLLPKPQSSIIFTGSNIAIIPAAILPAYSASKAALNAFTLCLRNQLRDTNTKVLEISPPPVQTEIHDYMGEETGRNLGMPLGAFTEEAYNGLISGKDQIIIGSIGPADTFNEIVDKRRNAFENLAKAMREVWDRV